MAIKKAPKKITPELLYEVLDGVYGDPKVRGKKLRESGYNPSVVTKKLNELGKIAEKLKPILDESGEYISIVMEIARGIDQ